ncbi:putative tat pathway signal sequence [Phaeomoniella chlamydospora]|uniref:Putative tat pathway signal sequence n=1 Tax=Phaeomoniella chlamydospora TaxID=158046 RepID=A0A0G2EYW4_PHACM|nr:putative tat pathway signal sequence [Phaeomoniella chlamydospora]
MEAFTAGGWWHDPSILAATGEGVEKEELRAWAGWWNEAIVELVRLSMQQKDALTVLLTGRSEAAFSDLIKRIVASKNLEFDLIVLKPEVGPTGQFFTSTGDFKKDFLEYLVFTYKSAEEIKIYEDRPRHTKMFREFFEKMKKSLLSHPIDQPSPPRKPINAEVIQVTELTQYLDPVSEISAVQRLINEHNRVVSSPQSSTATNKVKSPHGRFFIKRNAIYTAYLLSQQDSARLLTLITNSLPQGLVDTGEIKLLASSILISPRPIDQVPSSILSKAGGIGKKVLWQVTGTGILDNKVWAARLLPIGLRNGETIHTMDGGTPVCVLAVRKGGRPADASKITEWTPVDEGRGFVFESVVGEKVILQLEKEESETENDGPYRGYKRKFANQSGDNYHRDNKEFNYRENRNTGRRGGFSGRGRSGNAQARNRGDGTRNTSPPASGRGNDRRDRAGGGGSRRNREGRGGYKSLDDYGPGGNGYDGMYESRGANEGGVPVMNY